VVKLHVQAVTHRSGTRHRDQHALQNVPTLYPSGVLQLPHHAHLHNCADEAGTGWGAPAEEHFAVSVIGHEELEHVVVPPSEALISLAVLTGLAHRL